jgi:2-oxoglutarate dehydrogenase E2 component (dihydrolipoamide succinyltransferase)
MAVEIKVPEAGESITEVQVGSWLKEEGEYVNQDEIVAEIETDKAAMEIPAPAAGALQKINKKAGEFANVGDVLGTIDETAEAPKESSPSKPQPSEEAEPAEEAENIKQPPAEQKPAAPQTQESKGDGSRTKIMPAAQRLLTEHDLAAENVQATGPGGRLLKEDVTRHLSENAPAEPQDHEPAAEGKPTAVRAGGDREEEVVPMSMLRRRVAGRLVEAQQTAALLTTFNEVDMSAVMALRKQYQDDFLKKYDIKLGFMSFFIKAAIEGLKEFPAVNAQVRDQDIVYHNYYDIGVAVSTEKGLVVPVVRNAERLSFAQVEQAISDLATRGRNNKLKLEELEGGTFSITNGGIFGSMMSTPIVNPPQSAILGLHAIQDRPVVRDGEIVARPMMYIALTYDHRIIDGREAVTFLRRIKECIESPTRILIEV